MAGLSQHDRARADELRSSLTTLTLDGPPALSWAMEALRELLGTDRSVACSYEPHGDGLRLGESWESCMPDGFLPAVDAFLNRRIGFLDIPRVVETTLNDSPNANASVDTLDGVLAIDARARELAAGICRRVVN